MTFDNLKLIEPILTALQQANYTTPTPIQREAIPIILDGTDLLGCAQTGTGKTAAFSIPIIQKLAEAYRPARYQNIKALVLTPTRELAIQIDESFEAYGRNTQLRHTVVFGGVSQKNQTDILKRGVDILIATPGRLLDLIKQGYIKLNTIEFFVLDEADRMLDMGFIHDIKRLLPLLPKKRQTLFFSATMPPEIAKLANSMLYNPKKVEVAPVSSTVDTIEQSVYYVEKKDKIDLLIDLLQDQSLESILVFARTKHGSDKIARMLNKANIRTEAIHGNKSQNARQNALSNFKSRKTRVLIATDIAARGIDVDSLSHVFNYDLPNVPETYVHRIGRTGRAGKSGVAISFCDREELPLLKDIHKLIKKNIPAVTDHAYVETSSTNKPKSEAAKPKEQSSNNNRQPKVIKRQK
ncbi:DEAD/DEAH box helicase [Dysgonomonas sp. ZJ279]|uniref:DEAD/DEAH box helicase n=1 Tax=Dysgonomonas sp. ZJ279 TaxID=2709796 RepID=UPI0013EA90CA|nr:DEAD/DEAH box helicase [Dysgonomonas sp. ZJ279]